MTVYNYFQNEANSLFYPLPVLPPEGQIKTLPVKILVQVLSSVKMSDLSNTSLVSHFWNVATLPVYTNRHQQALEHFIGLLTENLQKHRRSIANLAKIQDMHQTLSRHLVNHGQTKQLSLITKGSIVGVLKKLTHDRISRLQQDIGDQLPSSLSHTFRFTKLTLDKAVFTGDFDTFCMILHSRRWSKNHRGHALFLMAERGHRQMLRILSVKGSIPIGFVESAIKIALFNKHKEFIHVLLDSIKVDEMDRYEYFAECISRRIGMLKRPNNYSQLPAHIIKNKLLQAITHNNFSLVHVIQSSVKISEDCQRKAVTKASKRNDLGIVQLLLAHGTLSPNTQKKAIRLATSHNNATLILLLKKQHPAASAPKPASLF